MDNKNSKYKLFEICTFMQRFLDFLIQEERKIYFCINLQCTICNKVINSVL